MAAASRWSRKWKIAFLLMLFALWMSPALRAQRDVRAQLTKASERAKAPPFELVADSRAKVNLSDYRGKVILLNFWATDCGGCVLEIPTLIDIERDLGQNDFTVVGIDMDMPYEGVKTANEAWKNVRAFMPTHGMKYPVLMGTSATENLYKIDAYPASFIIDQSGHIAAKYVGIIDKENVEANVRTLLHGE